MKLMELGGVEPRAILEGTADELRALAPLLYQDVLVIAANSARVDAPGLLIEKLNARRIALGLSWRTVATQCGCQPSALSRWANGKGFPSVHTLLACARWAEQGP